MRPLTNGLYELKSELDEKHKIKIDKLLYIAESLEDLKDAVLTKNGVIQVSAREYGLWKSTIEAQRLRRSSEEEYLDEVIEENRWLRRVICEYEKMTAQKIEIVNEEPKIRFLFF